MRELRFKAYIKRLKTIVDVVSINFEDGHITWDDNQFSRAIPPEKYYEIAMFDDIELLEYTGLKDKNGKEVFEGDIIKIDNSLLEVVFINGSFSVVGLNLVYRVNLGDEIRRYYDKLIIIGNIHKNPELIEENHAQSK